MRKGSRRASKRMDRQDSCVPGQPYVGPSPRACAAKPWQPCGWPPAGPKKSGAAALLAFGMLTKQGEADGLDWQVELRYGVLDPPPS